MKYLPTYEWIFLEELNKDLEFVKLLRLWDFSFRKAIELLFSNGVLYVKGRDNVTIDDVTPNVDITHIKRAFDNKSFRIEKDAKESDKQAEIEFF